MLPLAKENLMTGIRSGYDSRKSTIEEYSNEGWRWFEYVRRKALKVIDNQIAPGLSGKMKKIFDIFRPLAGELFWSARLSGGDPVGKLSLYSKGLYINSFMLPIYLIYAGASFDFTRQ
ncbi:hypothetical protein LZZ85_24350 [Terrimonas sp. NA20]|uniref:Uncharacterized protein n=1 Tax=Terrimonas ginsenosidimutans TaxID=2908004 RepID=A0ABS9KYJ2_9BACT|nr:hypothetical protein [Terrimonas ginsenosidimutans]MCG2617452.1 hypothetical protein [Terrimonas ginsenosidimutans]